MIAVARVILRENVARTRWSVATPLSTGYAGSQCAQVPAPATVLIVALLHFTIASVDNQPKRSFEPFWIAFGIDTIVALIFIYFFFVGLADGSIDSFNIVLWLVILLVLAGVLAGSLSLRAAARTGLATVLVTVLAVPSVLIGLFFLALLFAPAH